MIDLKPEVSHSMSILSTALQAVKEGEHSPAFMRLRRKISGEDRPYPYIIAVDFDGTLCENHWPKIGRENKELLEVLSFLRQLGALSVLWTCREGEDLEMALEWCDARGLRFDAVNENCPCVMEHFQWNTRKVHADEYWDDRAVTVYFNPKEEA